MTEEIESLDDIPSSFLHAYVSFLQTDDIHAMTTGEGAEQSSLWGAMDQPSRGAPCKVAVPSGIVKTNDPTQLTESTLFTMDPGHVRPEDLDTEQLPDFQAVGPALRIFQFNVEGLSAAKRTILLAGLCLKSY